MNEVIFLKGLQANFNALANKQDNIFYYCTDTHNLYIGEYLLTNGNDLSAALARISANESDIDTLQGNIQTLNADSSTTGSVRNVIATEIAKVIAGADASFDTLKEIADWISGHASDAAGMNSEIQGLKTLVGTIPKKGGTGSDKDDPIAATVIDYVDHKTGAEISALDSNAVIASKSGNIVTIKAGLNETDGIVSNNSDSDIQLAAVATTGTANSVSISDAGNIYVATNVEAALQEVKAIADANATLLTWQEF